MQGQGDRDAPSNSLININPDQQRQMDFFRDWLNQGSPHLLIGQMRESGIDSENHRRAFTELMNQVDAELTARGIGFQRKHPGNGRVENESLMVQQANVSAAQHTSSIDLNATREQQQEIGGGQTLSTPAKPDGPVATADQNILPAAGVDSSKPILISSGGGNPLKAVGDTSGQGHGKGGASSSNNNRPSFKRRAPGDAPRQLLLGESSSSVQQEQARESEQDDVVAAPQEIGGTVALNNEITGVGMLGAANSSAMNGTQNVAAAGITVLEAGIGGAPTVNQHHPSSVAAANRLGGSSVMNQNQISNEARNGAAAAAPPGFINNNNQASIRARQTEIFERNIRVRRNPNLQDFTPAARALTQSSPRQTAMFYPFDHFLNSLPQPQFHPTPAPQFVREPEPFQTQQVQGITMPSGSPSSSAYTPQLQPRNVMFRAAQFEPGSSSHMAANMNLANGNPNVPGNAAAAATQDGSNSRISAVPFWYPRQAINYSNRMLEVLRRAESRGLQGDYRPLHAADAAREMDNSSRGGNMRLQPRRSGFVPSDERRDGDHPDIPGSSIPLAFEVYMLNYI